MQAWNSNRYKVCTRRQITKVDVVDSLPIRVCYDEETRVGRTGRVNTRSRRALDGAEVTSNDDPALPVAMRKSPLVASRKSPPLD